MTQLSDIHDRIRLIMAKGNSLDPQIVSAVRAAARKIEQNRTYQYMKKFGSFTFDLTANNPRFIDLPASVKRIRQIRLNASGRYYRIQRGANEQELCLEGGAPTSYELDGVSRLIFNTEPDAAYVIEVFADYYTSWPTVDSATNWLIENGEEALVREATFLLRGDNRDKRQAEMDKLLRDEAYHSLLIADEELADTDYSSAMIFTPEGGLSFDTVS
jgi:hypothetical protein